MSKRTDRDFILDIHEAVKRILNYSEGIGYRDFLEDVKT